jgi:cytochrome b6-f complex iron-sulfur subunit
MRNDEGSISVSGRRDFLGLAIAGTATALGVTAALPGIAFLRPDSRRVIGTASAGKVHDFQVGTARMVLLDDRPVLVIRLAEGGFRAFLAACTHLGCIVKYSPERHRIECPCHRGVYSIDGSNVSGPPPRPLIALKVEVESGEIFVRST